MKHLIWKIETGYLFAFGSNQNGQLGVGDQKLKFSASPLLVNCSFGNPKQISAGGSHSSLLT